MKGFNQESNRVRVSLWQLPTGQRAEDGLEEARPGPGNQRASYLCSQGQHDDDLPMKGQRRGWVSDAYEGSSAGFGETLGLSEVTRGSDP